MAEGVLGARERQIMDVLVRLERATVQQVLEQLADPPSYSAVRGMLRLLEDKRLVRHEQDGLKYVYLPTVAKEKAGKSALKHLVQTFFGGSARDAAAALLDLDDPASVESMRKRLRRAGKPGKDGK